MGSTYDRILSARPVNKTAGLVTSGGIHWEPEVKLPESYWRFDAPPAVVHPSNYPAERSFEDLRGRQFGRFTVFGYLGKRNPKDKGLWLVRCVCGAYESRSARAVRNPNNCNDACKHCLHLEFIKRR